MENIQTPTSGEPDLHFENIDIQPIGTTPMDTRVLKEPRGFMRILQCFFAILAFSTCAHFSSYMEYDITCRGDPQPIAVKHPFSYPFKLDQSNVFLFKCHNSTDGVAKIYPPGDFSSDAQFFVFTGVVSFIGTIACLVIYVFFSNIYSDESKRAPLIDFCFTVIVAVFWLSASAAWSNGLNGLKNIASLGWIYNTEGHPCCKESSTHTFIMTNIIKCDIVEQGSFSGANISAVLGFLNFFLWTTDLWFLYKETAWFASRAGASQQLEG